MRVIKDALRLLGEVFNGTSFEPGIRNTIALDPIEHDNPEDQKFVSELVTMFAYGLLKLDKEDAGEELNTGFATRIAGLSQYGSNYYSLAEPIFGANIVHEEETEDSREVIYHMGVAKGGKLEFLDKWFMLELGNKITGLTANDFRTEIEYHDKRLDLVDCELTTLTPSADRSPQEGTDQLHCHRREMTNYRTIPFFDLK